MAGRRPSTPRGSGPRGSSAHPTQPRAASRPASRPGQRPAASRPRTPAATKPPRPRLTGRAAILVLVLAVLVVSYASSMRAYLEQKQHLEALRASIADSRANIEQLEREKRRWHDPAFVEAQARERFGWVMPGEIGYQVIGEDGKPLDGDESLTDPEVVTEANRPEWWQSAWGSVVAAGNPEEATHPVDQIRVPEKKER